VSYSPGPASSHEAVYARALVELARAGLMEPRHEM